MAFVLDASAALAWHFRDETTPRSAELLTRAHAGELIHVTSHRPLEILNALTRASRRGRTDDRVTRLFLTSLLRCNIAVDDLSMGRQRAEARPLIVKHRLSAYDAAYLALALRLNVSLATSTGSCALRLKAKP